MNARALLAAVAALAACAFAPAAASAGTVSIVGSTLTHVPSPGQDGLLGVSYEDDDADRPDLIVSDHGGSLTAGSGCRAAGREAVKCPRKKVQRISLLGGDGNDILYNATFLPGVLNGQAGDDTLYGGFGADALVGGTGSDSANYGYRTRALTIDPDGVADDGVPGEGDSVAPDIEEIVGGSEDDTLAGGPGPNTLSGGAGADTIAARGTDRDRVSCGSEADSVAADPSDSVDGDCENVDVQAPPPAPMVAAPPPFPGAAVSTRPIRLTRDGRARVSVACPASGLLCRGTVTIRALPRG